LIQLNERRVGRGTEPARRGGGRRATRSRAADSDREGDRTATRRRWWVPPRPVAEALLDYVDNGVSTILVRGFEPHEDVVAYGTELIPRVRAGVADRERSDVATAPAS
jgi:hypothetical protein